MSFFAVESPGELTGWTSFTTLASDPVVLRAKVATTRTALGADADLRAVASIDFLGVAARVLSPALRSAVLDARVPVLELDRIWWRPAVPGPMRLAWDVRAWRPAGARDLFEAVVRPVITPVLTAYQTSFALSEQVLWGNVASALNGAATGLGTSIAHVLVRDLLELGELAGTARAVTPLFVRNSCCLFYRVPGGGLCGDCVLRASGG